jgi:hypothetical protein
MNHAKQRDKETRIEEVVLTAAIVAWAAFASLPARTVEIVPVAQPALETEAETIAEVASANGIEPIHMFGIAAQESSFGKAKVGDEGCSKGWFHINICKNREAASVIGFLKSEAEWVADRLNELGYQVDSRRAIARYNRPADPNYEYAELVEKRIGEINKFVKAEVTQPAD